MSAKDMEFSNQLQQNRDEILAIFKVPKALLDPQELNFASAEVAKAVFIEQVVSPMMKDFVQTLNEFLLPHYNDDSLFFDYVSPASESVESKNAWVASRVAAGAISPNEIRAMDNLPPFEGGDNIYLSAMQTPIGQSDLNQGKMLLGTVNKIEIPKKYNVQVKSYSRTAELRAEIIKGITAEVMSKKEKILPAKKKTEKQLLRESIWYEKIAKTNADERDMRKMLREQFTRQQRQVLSSLKEKSFIFDWDDEGEDGLFIKMFTPYMKTVVTKYGGIAGNMVDTDFSLSARAKDWINDNVKNFSGEINNTTKEKIQKALAQAVEEGEGIPEAAKRVRIVFSEANTSRATAIARTEIIHASNYASVEAWKQSDVVEGKEWLTSFDENTCEECQALDGKTKGLDDGFGNKDDLFGDAPEPPAHVNCRCTLIPVLKTKSAIFSEIKDKKNELEKTIQEVKETGQKEIAEIKEIKNKLNQIIVDDNG
jgi:SPP1 gp7 family putative phage head morphogenesis protein